MSLHTVEINVPQPDSNELEDTPPSDDREKPVDVDLVDGHFCSAFYLIYGQV